MKEVDAVGDNKKDQVTNRPEQGLEDREATEFVNVVDSLP